MRWLPLLLVMGCVKAGPVQRAAEPVSVGTVVVLASVDDPAVQLGPERVTERLQRELTARNLLPVALTPDLEAFTSARTTSRRLELLEEEHDVPLLLLVESTARFSSQINGRYRWTVDVTTTLSPADHPEEALQEAFTVPVALVYYHEREAEALAEAAAPVAAQVGRLLDTWIGLGR